MTGPTERSFEDALRLPPESEVALAGYLLSSLELSADDDILAAWRTEVASRLEVLDSGKVRPVPLEEARHSIFGMD